MIYKIDKKRKKEKEGVEEGREGKKAKAKSSIDKNTSQSDKRLN